MKLLESFIDFIIMFAFYSICRKMAALVVQSRFAGLKIEDDDHPGSDNQKTKKSKTNPNTKKIEPSKKTKTANNKSQV